MSQDGEPCLELSIGGRIDVKLFLVASLVKCCLLTDMNLNSCSAIGEFHSNIVFVHPFTPYGAFSRPSLILMENKESTEEKKGVSKRLDSIPVVDSFSTSPYSPRLSAWFAFDQCAISDAKVRI